MASNAATIAVGNLETGFFGSETGNLARTRKGSKKLNAALWTIQGLLAALFLFAGGMKLVMPLAALTQQSHLPGMFLRFIGVAEVLGAIGLLLPGIFRVKTGLTALAALGLVIIMNGAVALTLESNGAAMTIMPAVAGLLATVVAYYRWQVAPLAGR